MHTILQKKDAHTTKKSQPFFSPSFIQPKLTIGAPNDKYEQEADSMADKVMRMSQDTPGVQTKCADCEQEEMMQTKPLVQKMEGEEEEMMQTKPLVQKMEGEEEMMQTKPLVQKMGGEEEEMMQTKPLIQKMGGEEEEMMQTEPMLQKMGGEEEEQLQTKPLMLKSEGGGGVATQALTSQLNNTKGSGSHLPASTNSFMSQAFGSNFSNVKVHTDSNAVQMNQDLNAKAFTHGSDIYFNKGQYAPESSDGKKLLAHELTHVVQQGKRTHFLQRQPTTVIPAQSSPVCYQAGANQPIPTAREPELHITYESWLSSFRGMVTFNSRDTIENGVETTGFHVLGDRAASNDPTAPENERPVEFSGAQRRDHFVDHPTQSWVNTCLPANLRETAYELPSDCADIAVILRHVWLAAHHRTESYNGWTVGSRIGASRQAEMRNLIVNQVYSGNVQQMINPYSDSRGNPIRDFNQLENLLHPGDILVWAHHSGGIGTRRTGGHTHTIVNISRSESGSIIEIEAIQGNQPIFERQAQEIRQNASDAPSESNLRDSPGRRIEVSRLNSLSLRNLQETISSNSEETIPVWTWADGHTTLVAAGPPRSASRPVASTRDDSGRRVRRITDWNSAISAATATTLTGVLEALSIEIRSLMERDQSIVDNQVTDENASALGQALGQRFFTVFRNIRTNRQTIDSYFERLSQLRNILIRIGAVANRDNGNTNRLFTLIEHNLIEGAGTTIEEMRLNQSDAPAQIITGANFSGFLPNFRQSVEGARNFQSLIGICNQFGTQLWQASTDIATRGTSDDRPLYWTRLQIIRDIRVIQPSQFILNDAQRQQLVLTFEQSSRGMEDVQFTSGSDQKKILISGFDPFRLERDINTSNPSGAAILALDGQTITSNNGNISAQIEGVIFPVRFQDFNDRMVENFFGNYLSTGNRVDMIITISRGGGTNFEVERYAGRRRSTRATDNLEELSGGTMTNPVEPSGVGVGPEFLETTLPQETMTSSSGVEFDQTQVHSSSGEAIEGSGGGYLSNEIFYRVRLLSTEMGVPNTIPIGHLHTPLWMPREQIVAHTRHIIESVVNSWDVEQDVEQD